MRQRVIPFLLALALAACSGAKTQPQPVQAPAPAPPPPPLSDAERMSRFLLTMPKMKDCLTPLATKSRLPKTARLNFTYVSDAAGIVKEATLVKANFRFKDAAGCLEKTLLGLQLDAAGDEERRISLKIDLR
jgi:hypothetical protein